jgi:flagellar biosynthesis chaperone FliJ
MSGPSAYPLQALLDLRRRIEQRRARALADCQRSLEDHRRRAAEAAARQQQARDALTREKGPAIGEGVEIREFRVRQRYRQRLRDELTRRGEALSALREAVVRGERAVDEAARALARARRDRELVERDQAAWKRLRRQVASLRAEAELEQFVAARAPRED